MGYSNFTTLRQVTSHFGLKAKAVPDMFEEEIAHIAPTAWLTEALKLGRIAPLHNEKIKSERIISPILLSIANAFQEHLTLFSGESLDALPEEGLVGPCDFTMVLAPHLPYLESPIISLAEAKNDNLDYGIAQCAAQLYGAKIFNEKDGKHFPFLYGCATTGTDWQFLRFENDTFYIDTKIYTQIEEILGVWHHIIGLYLALEK
jgi:hypothetical protein